MINALNGYDILLRSLISIQCMDEAVMVYVFVLLAMLLICLLCFAVFSVVCAL